MTEPAVPVRRYRYEDVWTHMIALALLGSFGVILAVALTLIAISWPDAIGICAWWSVLCIVMAMSLQSRH